MVEFKIRLISDENFLYLCRLVIEAYKPREKKEFTSREFRRLTSRKFGGVEPQSLINLLSLNDLIKSPKRGIWQITEEAVEMYDNGLFSKK